MSPVSISSRALCFFVLLLSSFFIRPFSQSTAEDTWIGLPGCSKLDRRKRPLSKSRQSIPRAGRHQGTSLPAQVVYSWLKIACAVATLTGAGGMNETKILTQARVVPVGSKNLSRLSHTLGGSRTESLTSLCPLFLYLHVLGFFDLLLLSLFIRPVSHSTA